MSYSHSTEKLEVLMHGIKSIPPEKMKSLSSMVLDWVNISADNGDVVCPTLKITFFDDTTATITPQATAKD